MGGSGFSHDIMQAIAAFGGYFGSKLATQLAMGSANTGVAGYMGNAAATAALAIIAGIFPPTKKLATMIVAGGAIQIIARVLSDNTAFGTLTSQLGVGNAPPAAAPMGTSGYNSAGMGRGLYSPAGIYS